MHARRLSTGWFGWTARAAVVVICSLPQRAAAQGAMPQDDRPERKYQGLFGSRQGKPESKQDVQFRWSLLGGYDDNVTGTDATSFDPRYGVAGRYATANGEMSYTARGRRATFGGALMGGVRHYDANTSGTTPSAGASGGLTVKVSDKTTLGAGTGVSYSPYYSLRLVGVPVVDAPISDDLVVAPDAYALAQTSMFGVNAELRLSHTLGARSSLSGEYTYHETILASNSDYHFTLQGGRAGFTHHLTQYASARIGYGEQRHTTLVTGDQSSNHTIDVGIDYDRPLSFSRRTKVTVGSGSAILDNGYQTEYRLIGRVNVTREIGRSALASAGYSRDVQYVDGLTTPIYGDSVSAFMNGLVTRRIDVQASGSFFSGESGYSQRVKLESYGAGASVRFAFTRWLSATAQYTYAHYDFSEATVLLTSLPNRAARQGIRVGLTGLFR